MFIHFLNWLFGPRKMMITELREGFKRLSEQKCWTLNGQIYRTSHTRTV